MTIIRDTDFSFDFQPTPLDRFNSPTTTQGSATIQEVGIERMKKLENGKEYCELLTIGHNTAVVINLLIATMVIGIRPKKIKSINTVAWRGKSS